MGGTIFISYRRSEDAGFAGRLFDRLERTFRRRLFMDVDSIAPGQDFVAVLEARVAECDVLLALIGRGWLTATDHAGQRRLDSPDDFVRIEVGSGLAQGKRVIPVLIDDASMPRADQLPEDLKPLARRQGTRLSHDRFKADSDRLIRTLKQVLAEAEAPSLAGLGAAAAPSPGASAPPSPASGRGLSAPAELPEDEQQKPLPPGEVGADAPGEGAAAPNIPTSVDPRELPDLAVFKDIDAPWCPEMVIVPAGSFHMGSPEKEAERSGDEGPQHRVTIGKRFALGRHAVTVEQYRRFVAATGHDHSGGMFVYSGSEWKQDAAKSWQDPGFAQDDQHPVVGVSWRDAQAYAAWLSGELRRPYRLPTEAEWEYACRAGTTAPFSFGETVSPNQVNYDGNYTYGGGAKGIYRQKTVAVGSLPGNPWGLHEMHGNALEWVEDTWHDDYTGAPDDGSAWTEGEGITSDRNRVVRGGSWVSIPRDCRSACRYRSAPGGRSSVLGFRLARTLS